MSIILPDVQRGLSDRKRPMHKIADARSWPASSRQVSETSEGTVPTLIGWLIGGLFIGLASGLILGAALLFIAGLTGATF
jgi:hypothetical protein